ncbi:Hypothetical protein AA314_01312 [Archangium gephyra]|uniref:Uncharacterized protein n=1 Tax=Archangium gephyra TaxID=48 RepID=A0AAC8TCS0_9BACT|nr:Hypothetical protein AA314_01312 [Archangium gephyra]
MHGAGGNTHALAGARPGCPLAPGRRGGLFPRRDEDDAGGSGHGARVRLAQQVGAGRFGGGEAPDQQSRERHTTEQWQPLAEGRSLLLTRTGRAHLSRY